MKQLGAESRNLLRWGAFLLLMTLLVSTLWSRWKQPKEKAGGQGRAAVAQSVDGSALGLQLRRQDGDVVIQWNRTLPVFLHAQRARLVLAEGQDKSELSLSAEQLWMSQVLYAPRVADLEVSLSVFSGEQWVTEVARVLIPKASAVVSQNVISSTSVRGPLPTRIQHFETGASRAGRSETVLLPKTDTTATRSNSTVISPPSLAMPSQTRQEVPRPPSSVELTELPTASSTSNRTVGLTSNETMSAARQYGGEAAAGAKVDDPASRQEAVAQAKNQPPVQPVTNPTPPPSTASPAVSQAKVLDSSEALTPPKSILQVKPQYPRIPNWEVRVLTVIRVAVNIDQRGTVTEAKLLEVVGPKSQPLVDSCLEAARQWKFEAARFRGKALPATHTINFKFPPRR